MKEKDKDLKLDDIASGAPLIKTADKNVRFVLYKQAANGREVRRAGAWRGKGFPTGLTLALSGRSRADTAASPDAGALGVLHGPLPALPVAAKRPPPTPPRPPRPSAGGAGEHLGRHPPRYVRGRVQAPRAAQPQGPLQAVPDRAHPHPPRPHLGRPDQAGPPGGHPRESPRHDWATPPGPGAASPTPTGRTRAPKPPGQGPTGADPPPPTPRSGPWGIRRRRRRSRRRRRCARRSTRRTRPWWPT